MQYLEAEKAIATTYYKDLFKRLSKKYGDLEETSRKIKVVRRVSEFATTVEEKTLLELVVEGHLDHVKSNIFLRLVYDLWGGVQRYITQTSQKQKAVYPLANREAIESKRCKRIDQAHLRSLFFKGSGSAKRKASNRASKSSSANRFFSSTYSAKTFIRS